MMEVKKFFLSLIIFFIVYNCSSSSKYKKGSNIFEEARENYLAGLKALKNDSYEEAISYFQKVSRGQRYIKYTPLAKIRIGDTFYAQEKFEEAIGAYRDYIESSAGDQNLHYAFFRIGECSYRAIPATFFLLPPVEEKDMTYVLRAYNAIDEFIQKFPNSPYVPVALKFYRECFQYILKHEVGIIDFYFNRKKYPAVISRIEDLFKNYPQSKNIESLHYILTQSYARIKGEEMKKK